MYNLGKKAYKSKNPIYIYKNSVEIPPLGMVDDELVISVLLNPKNKTVKIDNLYGSPTC